MAKAEITKQVYPFVGIAVALLAVLIVAGMDAASLIADDLRNGVTGAAGFLGLIFLVKILDNL